MSPLDRPASRRTSGAAALRRRAETLLQASPPPGAGGEAAADPQSLLHELQVHQIELELQNEQLRQAQAETETALERFADFHDFSPAGFFTLGQDGTILQVNLSGARLLGLERGRLIGRRLGTFVSPAGRLVFGDFLQGMFAGGARRVCELELLGEAPSARIVQVTARLSPDRRECRTVVVDITEQKQVERALRESERRFRDIAGISADWVWEVDVAGRYTYASENVQELLGYAPDELVGKTAFELMPADEALRVEQEFNAFVRRGEAFRDLENIVLDSQGGRHDTLTNGTPILDATGRVIGYRGVDRDVTRRRQTETALKASEQRFRDLVNTTDGVVWEADANTLDFSFASQQAERLLGYPVADWLQPGFCVRNLHPDDRGWVSDYCLSHRTSPTPFDFDCRFTAQDGRTVWLHVIVTTVAKNGAPCWLRGIMVDITQRKQIEQRLREMAETLEFKVLERTAELRKLSAQLTLAEERERRLLAQDLHDNLGQLLAVIKIKLTSLPGDAPVPWLTEILGLVDQADRAARDVSQALSPPILQNLGLAPALEWLGEEIERVYGLAVHVDRGECCKHLAEEIQAVLYRSARELLINVARHAGVREASLSCLCDGDRLVIVVSDAGCGFDPAEHFGTWPGHRSFGLRSIHERIISFGGEVEVDSSPGCGTTVTLSLPRLIGEKDICDDPHTAGR